MYNPAFELRSLFGTWRAALESDHLTAIQARSDEPANPLFDAGLHIDGIRHLLALEKRLVELKEEGIDSEIYGRYVYTWTARLFNYPFGWRDAVLDPDQAFPQAELDMLSTLGTILRMRQPQRDPVQLLNLGSVAAQVLSLVEEDETLSPALAQYLNSLAREISAALDDEKYLAEFDVSAAATRLWVALQAAAGQSQDDEKKARWAQAAKSFVFNVSTGALGSVPGVVVQALTAGS